MNTFELTVRLALFLGVLGIGVALGTALGLAQLQISCHHATPPSQTNTIDVVELDDQPTQPTGNPCYTGALNLQLIANISGSIGAVLLLGGAVVDTYEDRIRGVLS